jgi:hypothetical protein
MTKTRAQLIDEALLELGARGSGQAAAPEDYQNIDGVVDAVMADLAERDIYVWGDPDEIDDAAFVHLAKLLANEKARSFGLAPDETKRLMCEARLRQLKQVILSGQPQQVDYF